LRQWNSAKPRFEALGVKLVAISPDTVAEARKMRDKHGLKMIVLSDESLSVIRQYNLVHTTFALVRGPIRPLAIPTTFLIDANGVVRWIDQFEDFRVRRSVDLVLAEVKAALTATPA
jgi:peroxiredoxin